MEQYLKWTDVLPDLRDIWYREWMLNYINIQFLLFTYEKCITYFVKFNFILDKVYMEPGG